MAFRPRSNPKKRLQPSPTGKSVRSTSGRHIIDRETDKIAQEVLAMSPEEIAAFLEERGLSHLTDPQRTAKLIEASLDDDGGEEDADGDIDPEPFAGSGTLHPETVPAGARRH